MSNTPRPHWVGILRRFKRLILLMSMARMAFAVLSAHTRVP